MLSLYRHHSQKTAPQCTSHNYITNTTTTNNNNIIIIITTTTQPYYGQAVAIRYGLDHSTI
jgi:hypothetical protein